MKGKRKMVIGICAIVSPSGFAVAAIWPGASVPEPPGRFSMTIDCPRCFSVAVASARMPTSVVPPAGHGRMRVMGPHREILRLRGADPCGQFDRERDAKNGAFHDVSLPSRTGILQSIREPSLRLGPITFCRKRAARLVSAHRFDDSCPDDRDA